LSQTDIQELAFQTTTSLKTTGHILIVNWTGETDTPCTGDEAANCFILPEHLLEKMLQPYEIFIAL